VYSTAKLSQADWERPFAGDRKKEMAAIEMVSTDVLMKRML
jgi:hypothetical protein